MKQLIVRGYIDRKCTF